ncbi:MAG: 2-oxoacid:acceptor oxidoreductase subunit alpha [Candidatus Kapabacteria bacterium]|nr:2-oxoacid:acceptor oxidoreductase subunit alpha [Candidatus Kapabacteria bacterium]
MSKQIQKLEEVTIRFAGDSGDGMQLTGSQFSNTSGAFGNDVNTFPDYPSEIRAPEGTLYGVSAYQVHFGSKPVSTPGNQIDILIAMNASSLKVNLAALKKNGIIIANTAGFGDKNLKLAKYESNPLTDDSLKSFQLFAIDINTMVSEILKETKLSPKNIDRTKNLFALGLMYWLFGLPLDTTEKWLKTKFKKKQDILDANLAVLKAGHAYGEIREDFAIRYEVSSAKLKKGTYRNITGNEAAAIGLVVAAKKANLPLFLGSYPITPATEILHFISGYKKYGVKHLQGEDEIAGICSAIGASFGGNLAATTTSGPGLSLKVEAMGLAVILELPLVIINVQRGGPSTGLPTKPEQSDLLMAMFGRHGEAPMPILAADSASDCFDMTFEAARIALKYMTPVIMLSDGYLAQGTNPWRVTKLEDLPDISVNFATDPETFQPYKRDPETLARMWAIPGIEGLEHRIGGLEKEDVTGLVSMEAKNHEKMVKLRAEKVERIANDIPEATIDGPEEGDILVLGWGSTRGAIEEAIEKVRSEGNVISYCHLKYLNPFPRNLEKILSSFKRIIVPELNNGQLSWMIQAKFLIKVHGLNKIQGTPMNAHEVENKLNELLNQ